MIREHAQKLTALTIWTNLRQVKLEEIYKESPRMKKFMAAIR